MTNRWGITSIFIIALVGYIAYTVGQTSQRLATAVNSWDVVVATFNGRHWLHHGLNNLFFYLISQLALLGEFGPYLLLRTPSRSSWFWLQLSHVTIATAVFVLLLALCLFGVTAVYLPWSFTWSPASRLMLIESGFLADTLLRWPPFLTSFCMLLLLSLFWLSIGLLITAVTLRSQNAIAGFLVGLFFNYAAFLWWHSPIDLAWFNNLSWHHQLIFWPAGEFTSSLTTIFWTKLSYWLIWLLATAAWLWHVCQTVDIVRDQR